MNTLKVSLCTLFCCTCIFSQESKIDSLKIDFRNSITELQKLAILDSLSLLLINKEKPQASLPYFKKFIKYARKLDKEKLEAKGYRYLSESYLKLEDSAKSLHNAKIGLNLSINDEIIQNLLSSNQLGRVYYHFKEYDKAIETYTKSIDKFNKTKTDSITSTLIKIHNNLGIAYGSIGSTDKEIEILLKASKYADKIKDYDGKNTSLYTIGWLYMSLEQYGKADNYFKESLKDSIHNSYQVMTDRVFHALGINSSRNGKLSEAIRYNNEALKRFRKTGDKLYEFDVLNNIAVVYERLKTPDSTEYYAKKALIIAEDINHKLAITGAKQTLSGAYLKQKNYGEAEKLLLEIAKDTIDEKIISFESKVDLYSKLTMLYEEKGDISKSLIYLKAYKKANDSILVKQRDDNIAEIETKYQTKKKEKENLQLKADKAEQKRLTQDAINQRKKLAVGLVTSLLVLSIYIYFYQKNKKQKIRIENLQKELHHRVKNNLAIIDTFIEVAKEEFDDFKFEAKLTELQHRINSINEVHKQLYQSKDVTSLNIKSYVNSLVEQISLSFDNSQIIVNTAIDSRLKFKADKSFPIGLIINEFITNSFKHAFQDDTGKIDITLIEMERNYILTLSDTGKGLPPNFEINKTESFGMRMMKLLAEQLNGTFQLTNVNGVEIKITFQKTEL